MVRLGLYPETELFPNLLAGQQAFGAGMELPRPAPRIFGNPLTGLATLAGQEPPPAGRRLFGNPHAAPVPAGDLTGIAADVATGPQPMGRPGQFSPYDEVFARHAGPLAADSQFLAVVAAGAKAESGFNPRAVGDNGRSVGLFQMHQAGAGAGLGDARYDPEVQARVMVPRYAAAYQKYKAQGLTGPQLAAWTAAEAEKPLDWENPDSKAHANYRNAYMTVTSATTPGAPAPSAPRETGASVGGSWDRAAADLVPNQFGDQTLSAAEAAAACGPAAAVAFARATGRNPTLREATTIAKSTGWTEAGGMNGIGNQSRLLETMGVPHRVTPQVDWGEVSQSALGGSPVTISTPAHYFVIDAFNADTGQYHVGPSGTAFRAGARWMTAPQIQQLGRGVNGAIYLGAQP